MFRTAESEYHPEPHQSAPEAIVERVWRVGLGRPAPSSGSSTTAEARIEHGRWIVDCPYCKGAQFASKADRRFFCVDCGHEATSDEGRWLKVAWPRNPDEIEQELVRRPNVVNRNWKAGETVASLRNEFSAAQKVAIALEALPSLRQSLRAGTDDAQALSPDEKKLLLPGGGS